MPDLLTHDGQAYLVHPDTGETLAIPVDQARDALTAGLRPATGQEVDQARIQEHYSTGGQQVLTGLAGLARGVTLGGSDLLLTETGLAEPETLQHQQEANPTLATATDIGGSILGLAIPGGPVAKLVGLGAKAGTRAAAGTAGALTRRAGREVLESAALPRLAGSLAREGVIGAGLGVGHAVSDVALQELEGAEAAGQVLRGLAAGAGMGAGLGVLAFGAGTVGRRVRQRFDHGVKEVRELRAKRDQLLAEAEVFKASPLTPAGVLEGLESRLSDVGGQLQQAQGRIVGRVMTRSVAAGLALGLDMGVSGMVLGAIAAPRLVRAVRGALRPATTKIGGSLGRAAEHVTPWTSRVKGAWEVLRGTPVAGEAAEAAAQAAKTRAGQAARKYGHKIADKVPITAKGAETTLEALGHGAGEAAGVALAAGPELAVEGFLAGGATGAAIGVVSHRMRGKLLHLGDLMTRKVIPASKIAALNALTGADWALAADEIPHLDPSEIESGILAQLPPDVPQQLASAITGQVLRAIQYLQERHPGPEAAAGPAERYVRTVQAVARPDSVLEAFLRGDLTRDQVDALKGVYPQAHAQLAAVVRAELAAARAEDHDPGPRLQHLTAMLTGDRQAQAATARRVAMFQAARRGSEKPGPKPRARPVEGISTASETQAQRLQRTGG